MGGGGGRRGLFWPGSRERGYGWRIELKFGTNNGSDHISKHGKFYAIDFSTFRDMTSQKCPFQNGSGSLRFDIYPLESSKTWEKSLFMPENIFSCTNLYSLHFHGFEAKQKY